MTIENQILKEYNTMVLGANMKSFQNNGLIDFGNGTEDLRALSQIISTVNSGPPKRK